MRDPWHLNILYCGVPLRTQQGYVHSCAKKIFPAQYFRPSQAAGESQLFFYTKQSDDKLLWDSWSLILHWLCICDVKDFCDINCKCKGGFYFCPFCLFGNEFIVLLDSAFFFLFTSFRSLIQYVIVCRGKIHVIDFTIIWCFQSQFWMTSF